MSEKGKHATELQLVVSGKIELSERKPEEDGKYHSDELVTHTSDVIDLEVGFSNNTDWKDEVGFFFHLYEAHMVDEESKRGFHCGVDLELSIDDLKRLYAFIGYLIETHDD